jgi:hypothetical protein
MKEFFLKMFNAKDPTVSSSSFLSVVSVLTVLYAWLIVSIYLRELQDIPTGVYAFVGLIIAGKVGANFAGRPTADTSTQTSSETTSRSITKGNKK